ncbi:lipoprotein insertase outer membrane protein LolB [Solimonas marina]|uniref:Outer-membrane lipoprotein LolB n=1 Tax=Solimonas marina TaxID=2714601 RepID=A0A969WF63_9GAMM|nr:lipoprotein insertase outer membrane protein LolB [Solimonas marina]NKF23625.1 outer membrane lipoprotein LolB [Solimonas marina]
MIRSPLRWLLHATAAVSLLALGACATLPKPDTVDAAQVAGKWQAHRTAVAAISSFQLNGRAGAGNGIKADLRWRQYAGARFEARIAGPFGAGAVAISGTPHDVEIRTKDGTEQTTDPEGWMLQRAGWTFPIDGLRWWALGLPAPGTPAKTTFDAQGRLATLTQDGWTLQYLDYQEVGDLSLPHRFAATSAQIDLRLVVDQWQDIETSHNPPASS